MDSFQQVCPNCNATLELPREADGKAAVCPGCQTEFIAEVPTPDSETPDSKTQPTEVPPTETPQAAGASPIETAPPMAGREPYRQVSIESILGDTQTVFADRRRPLLLPFLIPSLVIVAGLVVPLAYLSELVASKPLKGLIWTGALMPWFVLVVSYTLWFALNLSVDVCNAGPEGENDRPERIRSWFVPPLRVLGVLTAVVAFGLVVLAVAIGVSILVVDSVGGIRATELRVLITVVAVGGSVGGVTLLATRLWPLIPLAIEAPDLPDMTQKSLAMTRPNLLTSFLMTIALFLVLGVGFSFLGLGLPIAIPLASLTLIVAYRLITGRRIPAFDRDEFR